MDPSLCDPLCPCCDLKNWPEFISTVEGHGPADSCYSREDDDGSNIVALVSCDEVGVAYMSYDYSDPEKNKVYCGDSRSDREELTAEEIGYCAGAILQAGIEGKSCNDEFFDCDTNGGEGDITLTPTPEPSIASTVAPLTIPPIVPTEPSLCDPLCPCCDSAKFPAFVSSVDSQGPTDSCYTREDIDGSNIVALVSCDDVGIAYMSYDYNFPGAAPGDPTLYCGDNGDDREIVTEEEAVFCDSVLSVAVQEGKKCNDKFLDCDEPTRRH